MKIIPLTEAKARLSHYGRLCAKEPVIVTVNGAPAFELVPLDEDDDLINQLLEHNPDFRKMLKDRLDEKPISLNQVLRRL
jgi:prevent-host-death family protein